MVFLGSTDENDEITTQFNFYSDHGIVLPRRKLFHRSTADNDDI